MCRGFCTLSALQSTRVPGLSGITGHRRPRGDQRVVCTATWQTNLVLIRSQFYQSSIHFDSICSLPPSSSILFHSLPSFSLLNLCSAPAWGRGAIPKQAFDCCLCRMEFRAIGAQMKRSTNWNSWRPQERLGKIAGISMRSMHSFFFEK